MYGLLNNMRVVCDPNVHLSDPFIGFVYVFVCRKYLLV